MPPLPESALIENFSEFGGADYRSNDKTRKPRFAKDSHNVEYLKNNSITCRKGSKGRASSQGGGGTRTYVQTDSSGTTTEEVITIDEELYRLVEGSFTITYSGASTDPSFALIPVLDGSTYEFQASCYEGTTETLNVSLGTGIDEASPVTVGDLVTAINALADFACVATGTTTGPAAFIGNIAGSAIGSGLTVSFEYWEQVYCPTSTPFDTFWADVNTDAFENATLFNHNNLLFIASHHHELYKYDGNSCYRAGMPAATTLAVSAVAGAGPTGTFYWFITYEQVDAVGNIVEGDQSNEVTVALVAQAGRVVMPTIQTSSEFLTSCAYANNGGTETGTTLTVDNNTLQVGQTAFFRDNGGTLQERLITARTATSITIEGAAVTIANNAVISANLRINLWRNVNGGSDKYLVRTFANDSVAASITYDDITSDASLAANAVYETPIVGHGLPPANMKYITAYQNSLILADHSNDAWYSDPDGPEYFNDYFTIRSKSNERVRGVGSNKELLAVFKSNEAHVVIGDLPAARYRNELLADAIGCDSHHSIVDVDGSLWFYSGKFGMRRIVSVGLPEDVSYRILPVITSPTGDSASELVHKRAVSVYLPLLQLILFYVPTETAHGSEIVPNVNSKVFAADVREQFDEDVDYDEQGRAMKRVPRVRWWVWGELNMAGGATVYDDKLVWTERRYGENVAGVEYSLCGRLEGNESYDYCDHARPIDWQYEAGWMDLGKSDLLKKFIKFILYSFPEGVAPYFSITSETELDYFNGDAHSRKEIVFGEAGSTGGWGNWSWDTIPWGEGVSPKKRFPLLPTRAFVVKLKLYANVFLQQPVISGWTLEAVPVYKMKAKQ